MSSYDEFDKYQTFTDTVAVYPKDVELAYTVCGLIGESCEYASKLAKVVDRGLKSIQEEFLKANQKRREELLSQIDNLRKLRVIIGEAASLGNAAEKFKKALRSGEKKIPPLPDLTDDQLGALRKELGDVQWYVARSAVALNATLSEIVEDNATKLLSRKERGVIQGNGDNR